MSETILIILVVVLILVFARQILGGIFLFCVAVFALFCLIGAGTLFFLVAILELLDKNIAPEWRRNRRIAKHKKKFAARKEIR